MRDLMKVAVGLVVLALLVFFPHWVGTLAVATGTPALVTWMIGVLVCYVIIAITFLLVRLALFVGDIFFS
ncbi:hypothetical protein [Myxococcus phage Mx1]|nr:hypothetical protein [Myxococcus phage Mx1]